MRKKKWNWARSWGSTPGSLNFYGGQEARHECYLPSMLALGFAYTILASELETIHSKNKMKIRVSYFLLPQRQLNFQNLIIWLLYICYLLHFDPNVTKKKTEHKSFIIYQIEQYHVFSKLFQMSVDRKWNICSCSFIEGLSHSWCDMFFWS